MGIEFKKWLIGFLTDLTFGFFGIGDLDFAYSTSKKLESYLKKKWGIS